MEIKSNLAIICVRSQSKGIPGKNIKEFCGKPLLNWAIDSCLEAKNISRILVSTDSKLIQKIAINNGAEAPFIRPMNLSTDKIALEPVISHAIKWLKRNENYNPSSVSLIPVTNPLRKSIHIDKCVDKFYKTKADSVMTVHESPACYTPYWSVVYNKKNGASFYGGVDLKDAYIQRQSFPEKIYARNDIAYTFKPSNIFDLKPSLYGKNNEILIMDEIYDGDINKIEDWKIVEDRFLWLKKNSRL